MKQADLVYQTWVVASSFHAALDLEKAWGEDGLWQQIHALEHRFLRPCGRFNACVPCRVTVNQGRPSLVCQPSCANEYIVY